MACHPLCPASQGRTRLATSAPDVLAPQPGQLVADHLADPAAELLRLVGGVRPLGHDDVDDPGARAGRASAPAGPAPSPGRGRGRGARSRSRPRAAAGRARRAARRRPGRPGSSASAPPPVPCPSISDRVGARRLTSVGERPGDLAGHPALLGLHRQRGAGGVDDGEQRQPELLGEPHPAPRLAQRRRTERRGLGLPAPVLGEQHARGVPEPRQRQHQPGLGLALAGPVEGYDVGGGVLQQPADPGRSSRRDRVIDSQVSTSVDRLGRQRRHHGVARRLQDRQRPVEEVGDLARARRPRR